MSGVRISVAMSCYNGNKFLATQLDSILKQTFPVSSVSVVDDGSSDGTLDLLNSYASEDSRVSVCAMSKNVGVNGAFGEAVLRCPESDWYALADQDDFWPADRIENFLHEVRLRGYENNEPIPVLFVCQFLSVASDSVLDGSGGVHSRELGILNSGIDWPRVLMAGNPLYGCCFFFNKALRDLVCPIPAGKTTHDYWISILAACLGRIHVVDFVGTHYRQHSSNASFGAPSSGVMGKFRNLNRSLLMDLRSRSDQMNVIDALKDRLSTAGLSKDNELLLSTFSVGYRKGGLYLLYCQVVNSVWRLGFAPNLVRVAACVLQSFGFRGRL